MFEFKHNVTQDLKNSQKKIQTSGSRDKGSLPR